MRNLIKEITEELKNKNQTSKRDLMTKFEIDELEAMNYLMGVAAKTAYMNPEKNPLFKKNDIELNQATWIEINRFVKLLERRLNDDQFRFKNRYIGLKAIELIKSKLPKKNKKDDLILEIMFSDYTKLEVALKKFKPEIISFFNIESNRIDFINKLTEFLSVNKDCETKCLLLVNSIGNVLSSLNIKVKQNILDKLINKENTSDNKHLVILNRYLKESNKSTKLSHDFGISMYDNLDEIEFTKKVLRPNFYADHTEVKTFTLDKSNYGCLEDAISIFEIKDKVYLTIYISDPYAVIDKDGMIDKIARKNMKTIYNCGRPITMFPEFYAYDKMSLIKGENRKTIAHQFEFSKTFDLISYQTFRAVINTNKNISFDNFDKGNDNEFYKEALLLEKLLSVLKKEFPKIEGHYINKEKHKNIYHEDLTGEFSWNVITHQKIFLNNYIAEMFRKSNLPLIHYNVQTDTNYKNQLKNIRSISDISSNNFNEQFAFSTEGIRNHELDLSLYTKASTPVRSYVSLTNQHLLVKFFINKEKLSTRELYDLLNELRTIAEEANQKQKLINSFKKEFRRFNS